MGFNSGLKGLNTICHLLALLGAHHILHVSGVRVKREDNGFAYFDRVWMGDRENERLRNKIWQTLPKSICS
jgi:hypothetical protein